MIVDSKELAKTIALLERVLPNKALDVFQTMIQLQFLPNKLIARAVSSDIDLEFYFLVPNDEIATVLVSAKTIGPLVKNLEGLQTNLHIKGNELELTSNNFISRIRISKDNNYPNRTTEFNDNKSIPTWILAKHIDKVIYATAKEDYRGVFKGVQLEQINNNLHSYATDGYRLAHYTTEGLPGNDFKTLLTTTSADTITKIIKEKNQENLTINLKNNQFIASFSTGKIVVNTMEGRLPDKEKILPKEYLTEITIEPKSLLASLERLRPLTPKFSNQINITIQNKHLEITAENEEGRGKEEIPCQNKGILPFSIAMNLDYLKEALEANKHEVSIQFSGPNNPILISSQYKGKYIALLMPIKN